MIPNMKISQYHRVLNVPEGASTETIKRVTKELLKKYHPDLNQKHRQWADTQTKRILEAYQVLVRKPSTAPKMITKGSPYQGTVHIQMVEKKQSYMETIFADKMGLSKVFIDVHSIECVIPANAIEWQLPQVAGSYRDESIFIINGILSLNLQPTDGAYKALFLKKTNSSVPQLAYLFRDGGRFFEIKESEKKDFLFETWGRVELPSWGGNAYLSSPQLIAIESLF